MSYNEITNISSPNYTAGRPGGGIRGITIHHWGDPVQGPTAEGVVSHLCNPAAQVSAHFVATGTGRRVWQLVDDQNTAWHAGNWTGNITTIGIECDPRCRDEDYDVVAELVADLWRYYGKLPLYPHKNWVATACPGNYDLGRIQREAEAKLNPPAPEPEKLVWANITPVKLVTRNDLTYVVDVVSGANQGNPLSKGTPVDFLSKATYKGVTWLRSTYATSKGFNWGIPENLMESPPVPVPQPTPIPVEPDYDKENNGLLKWIVALLKKIFNVQ